MSQDTFLVAFATPEKQYFPGSDVQEVAKWQASQLFTS